MIEILTSNFYITTVNKFIFLNERNSIDNIGQVKNSNLFYQSFKNIELLITYNNNTQIELMMDYVPTFDLK